MYIVLGADLTSHNDQILCSPLYSHYWITFAIPVQPVPGEKQGAGVLLCDMTEMSFTLKKRRNGD
jgi:hypothetical protein